MNYDFVFYLDLRIFLKLIFIFECSGFSLLCPGFLWLSQVGAPPCCCARASDSVASLVAELRLFGCTGLVAPRHVGSSRNTDQTCVPCIGRLILNHWITRDIL